MKRVFSFLILMFILLLLPAVVIAVNSPIDLYINGKKVNTEIPPKVIDNHTYISLQSVAKDIGVEVKWDLNTNKAVLHHEGITIETIVNSSIAEVNGVPVGLGTDVVMMEGRMYIPLRFLGEQLGFKSTWDVLTSSIFLYKKDKSFMSSKEIFEITSTDGGILPKQDEEEIVVPDGKSILNSIHSVGNKIVIQLDKMVSPTSFYLSGPNRYVIDIPTSKLAPSFIAQQGEIASNSSHVNKIRYAIHNASTIRIVIELTQQAKFDLIENTENNQIIAAIPDKIYRVVLDPGHGGKDPGAEGVSGEYEKKFNLNVSNKIIDILESEASIQTFMTRTEDTFINLDDRSTFANEVKGDLFVSIHGNTFTSLVSGTETYYWNRESLDFALIMHENVVGGTKLPDRRLRKMQYRVLRDTNMPSVLLELGYLTNAEEEKKMLTDKFQNDVAASVVTAIKQYLKIKEIN